MAATQSHAVRLESMPAMLLVRGGATDDPALPALLETMADEVLSRRVGAAGVMTRLADVVGGFRPPPGF